MFWVGCSLGLKVLLDSDDDSVMRWLEAITLLMMLSALLIELLRLDSVWSLPVLALLLLLDDDDDDDA